MSDNGNGIGVTYDPISDAAYIHLTETDLEPGRNTVQVEVPTSAAGAMVLMDWKNGKLTGVEVLDASYYLHADLLELANGNGNR
jgi:uncharacterized protein YuzE